MVKKIIGMNTHGYRRHAVFGVQGLHRGTQPPPSSGSSPGGEAYVNPIPASLILTGIVVAVSTTAMLLALTVRLYEAYGTLDIRQMRDEKKGGHP
jgi:multicomponent Na+:H+ antiporter subunit C